VSLARVKNGSKMNVVAANRRGGGKLAPMRGHGTSERENSRRNIQHFSTSRSTRNAVRLF